MSQQNDSATVTVTVRQLRQMIADLPNRLDESHVLVHIAAAEGWAASHLRPRVGRSSDDSFVMLSTTLPDDLEQYFDEEQQATPLRVVK